MAHYDQSDLETTNKASNKSSYLSQIIDNVVPVPVLTSKLLPVVERRLAAWNPGEVVSRAASAKHLATSIGPLNTLILWALDEGGLVLPVIFAVPQVIGLCWGGDLVNLMRVATGQLSVKCKTGIL